MYNFLKIVFCVLYIDINPFCDSYDVQRTDLLGMLQETGLIAMKFLIHLAESLVVSICLYRSSKMWRGGTK